MRQTWLPKLVVAPSFVLGLAFVYGLMAWNGYLSVSASRLLPNYEFVGFAQYVTLFGNAGFLIAHKDANIAVGGVGIVSGMAPRGGFDVGMLEELIATAQIVGRC